MTHQRFVLFMVAGLLTCGRFARAQDEPDLKREKQFNRIYKNLNAKPTSEEKWGQALQTAKSQTYKVQKGDTLWDISETFFADPDFWPKIWSLNGDEILNPHEITPNEQVQFVPGTIGEPPSIGVAPAKNGVPETLAAADDEAKEDDAGRAAKSGPQYVDVDLRGVKLPTPRRATTKNATSLPASIPAWSYRAEDAKTELKMDVATARGPIPPMEVPILSYVQENRLEPAGEVTGAEGGMGAAHENQYVTVRLNGAASNQKYLIVREMGELAQDESAHIIQIEGEALVQDPVGDERTYRALVTRAHAPILTGDKLVPGEVQRVTVQDSGATGEASARVVGGPESDRRLIFGPGEILFLDGGSRGGLNVGQNLGIFRNEAARNNDTAERANPRRIASVHVVRTSDRFATAIVTSATEEVHVGDSTSRGAQIK